MGLEVNLNTSLENSFTNDQISKSTNLVTLTTMKSISIPHEKQKQ
jgi:hypothetical protein